MLDSALSVLAPHPCFSCEALGTPLCDSCKYNIVSDVFSGCVLCGKAAASGVCGNHAASYDRAFVVGERRDVLQNLIGAFKFQNGKAIARIVAGLLAVRLPQLPTDTVFVPLPTIAAHIRERGYDHTLLLARKLARIRRIPVEQLVVRQTKLVQHRADRAQRLVQAAEAFRIEGTVDPHKTYLLIDDIITTGASVEYAAQALKQAGATTVWVAAIARQPLD